MASENQTYTEKVDKMVALAPALYIDHLKTPLRALKTVFHEQPVPSVVRLVRTADIFIPCKKCDVDSHGNSMSFLVTNRRQFGQN